MPTQVTPTPPHLCVPADHIFDSLIDPYQHTDDDLMDRLQSDIPLVVKAHINSLFGRRGNIQRIINLTFYYLHRELKTKLNLNGYDPTINVDRIIATLLAGIDGRSELCTELILDAGSSIGGTAKFVSQLELEALVSSLVGPERSDRDRLPNTLPSANSSSSDQLGAGTPVDDPQTARDADGGSHPTRKSQRRGSGARSETAGQAKRKRSSASEAH